MSDGHILYWKNMPVTSVYRPEKALLSLDGGFYDAVKPAPFPRTVIRYRNNRAAATVGLDDLSDAEWIDHFARFTPLPGTLRAMAGALPLRNCVKRARDGCWNWVPRAVARRPGHARAMGD
jgi:hypothetical protein